MSEENNDEWKPDDESIEWAKEHLSQIAVGGIWSPEGSGVTYYKQSEDTYALMKLMEHPSALEHHCKMTKMMEAADYTVLEGDGVEYVQPPLNAEDAANKEHMHRQEMAQTWACSGCDFPLANFELENRIDTFIEDKEILLSNGDTQNVEIWTCEITCPKCDKKINIDPDDFHLLAGDDLFMRWTNSEHTRFMALNRSMLRELVDAGGSPIVIGSFCPDTNEKMPPWMWGVCVVSLEASSKISMQMYNQTNN
jgi:hypothetical protein